MGEHGWVGVAEWEVESVLGVGVGTGGGVGESGVGGV